MHQRFKDLRTNKLKKVRQMSPVCMENIQTIFQRSTALYGYLNWVSTGKYLLNSKK